MGGLYELQGYVRRRFRLADGLTDVLAGESWDALGVAWSEDPTDAVREPDPTDAVSEPLDPPLCPGPSSAVRGRWWQGGLISCPPRCPCPCPSSCRIASKISA
jgi:hypothetical protein